MVIEPVEEARLIEEAKRDAVAFARLYDEYMPAVYGYVYRRVSDRDAAEDITSSVFEKAIRGVGGLREGASFKGWLYRIAGNCIIDHYRARGRHPESELEEAVAAPDTESGRPIEELETRMAVMKLLDGMPEKHREILTLHYLEGLSVEEIAEATGKKPQACYMRIYRATRAFSEELAKKGITRGWTTMSRESKAQELVRAAGGGTGPVSPDVAVLLEAVAVLKAADGGHIAPDPAFAVSLRQKLIEEHASAAEAPVKVETGRVRRLLPAFAVGAAALAAIAVALVLFFVVKPAGPTVARLKVDVGAVQVTSGGRTRPVTASTDEKNGEVKAGDTVATYSGSRATLSFLNKDVTRLEAASTMKVDSYDSRDVGLVLKSGKAYCRVVQHGNFTVSANGIEVTATGTAFGVDARDGVVQSSVFEGDVKVTWPKGSHTLDQGMQLTIANKNGRYLGVVTEINPAADLSWLAFNRDLDRGLKLPLGILESLGATPPNGNPPPGTAPQVPGDSSPASSNPASSGRQPSPGPVSTSPAATNPQPGPQPTPQPNPGPEPTPVPGPQVTPSVSLSIASAGPPVVVTWSIQNGGSVTGVAVLKGVGVMDPAYPDHSVAVMSPANNSYKDKDVESGGTYSYRVALLSNGAFVALSNRQTVSISPQLSLSGKGQGTSVYISWTLSGVVHIDSWAVLRSGNNPSPSFPADQYATAGYSGPSGSYNDNNGSPNRNYYRVVGLYQGRVIVKSNTVQLP